MKKGRQITAIFLAAATMALSACTSGGKETTSPILPGTQWGGSIDQVLEDLGISRESLGENLVVDDEKTGSATAVLENQEIFGQQAAGTVLFFSGTQDGQGTFTRAEIYYPDSADMETVGKSMEEAFGPCAKTVTLYSQEGSVHTLTSGEETQYWQGQLLQEALSGEQQIALRQQVAHQGPDVGTKISDSQWENYLKNPLTTASWYVNYQSPLEEYAAEAFTGSTFRNVVILDGSLQVEVDSLS